MKFFKTLLLISFAFSFYYAKGQVVQYNVLKDNINYFDKEMQAFTGWKGWHNCYAGGRNSSGSYTFSFSQNAARYNYNFFISGDGPGLEDYERKTVIIFTFIGNEPTSEFPFRKKVSIKTASSLKNPVEPEGNYNTEFTGSGYIYSSATYESIMSGNSTANICVYSEMTDGMKGYVLRNINKNTQSEIDGVKVEKEEAEEEAKEEAADAKREKQERVNQNIKSIGNTLQILINKKN